MSFLPTLLSGGLALGSSIFGGGRQRSPKPRAYNLLDPSQRGLQSDLTKGLYGQGPFGQDFQFNPQQFQQMFQQTVAQPAYQSFQENVVPKITGQFRGQGLGTSSYLGNALSKAGQGVQTDLNQLLAQGQYQGQQDALTRRLEAIRNILGQRTQGFYTPTQSPSFFDKMLQGAGSHGLNYLLNRYLPLN